MSNVVSNFRATVLYPHVTPPDLAISLKDLGARQQSFAFYYLNPRARRAPDEKRAVLSWHGDVESYVLKHDEKVAAYLVDELGEIIVELMGDDADVLPCFTRYWGETEVIARARFLEWLLLGGKNRIEKRNW